MPVWEVIRDAMQAAHTDGHPWLVAGEVASAVEKYAPGTNQGTVSAQLRAICVNDPSSKHYGSAALRNPLIVTDDPTKRGKRYRLLTADERAVLKALPRGDLAEVSYVQLQEWLADPSVVLTPEGDAAGLADASDETVEAEGLALVELHLQDYLHRHWKSCFPNLELYEGDLGREFVTSDPAIGILDFLARDHVGNYMVIETKRDMADRRAVGQTLSYMGWVQTKLCEQGQSVSGTLLVGSVTDQLQMAVAPVPNLKLMTYQVSFALSHID